MKVIPVDLRLHVSRGVDALRVPHLVLVQAVARGSAAGRSVAEIKQAAQAGRKSAQLIAALHRTVDAVGK